MHCVCELYHSVHSLQLIAIDANERAQLRFFALLQKQDSPITKSDLHQEQRRRYKIGEDRLYFSL